MDEKLFYNGTIITMEKELTTEAVFIKDGIIEKVGTKEYVMKSKSDYTEMIDLKGKTLLPAFIDPHSHLSAFASTLRLVPLNEAISFQDIIQKIKQFKENHPLKPGDWIIGFGYDHNNLEEKSHPDRHVLDKASTDNPILISHASGHMGVLNTSGLREMNITGTSIDPEGGKIGRENDNNDPSGYMEENAFINLSSTLPRPSLEDLCNQMEEAQAIYFSCGIATAQEGIMKDQEFHILKKMADEKRLLIDLIGYVDLKNNHQLTKHTEYVKKYQNRFKIGGYKIFLDGSPQGKTAWMSEPYENSEDGYKGYPAYQNEEVEELIRTALDEDMQLLTHCNGDAAAEQLITSYQKMLDKAQRHTNLRPVMIHAQTVRNDQLDRMEPIGMIPSFFVEHTYFWGDTHIQNLGKERAFKISPVKSAIDKGLIYTLHQDTPVVPPDMMHTIWSAVNRLTKSGVAIGESEKVTALEAIRGITINAAYQYFEEDKKGSIKEGKLADLIILDKNPLETEPMTLKDIQILQTYKEGKSVYTKMR
ncbi:amidohydrolase [Bacillus sp. 1P06AnD]|uniref:amidohydrolase n=1 Tax=Bacillus sp. 1P06AnD TaxID=3132208 RepID=UPI0039A18B89